MRSSGAHVFILVCTLKSSYTPLVESLASIAARLSIHDSRSPVSSRQISGVGTAKQSIGLRTAHSRSAFSICKYLRDHSKFEVFGR